MLACAMRAAVEFSVAYFHAVPDDLAAAVFAARRHRMDRALEAVERATFPSFNDLKCLVVFVATDITLGHLFVLSLETNLASFLTMAEMGCYLATQFSKTTMVVG